MFLYLLMLAQLHCPTTKIVDLKGTEWVQRDYAALKTASRRCGEIYPGNPCLITFTKVEEGTYRAICGQKR
jgi:hypothetical protein